MRLLHRINISTAYVPPPRFIRGVARAIPGCRGQATARRRLEQLSTDPNHLGLFRILSLKILVASPSQALVRNDGIIF